jgi:hypothetical protein
MSPGAFRFSGYNLLMPRAALFALLVASILCGSSLQAQRLGATFHSSSVAKMPSRSGFVGQRGFPNRFFRSRSHTRNDSFGSGFFPYDEPFDYAQTDAEAVTDGAVPLVVIPRPDERLSRTSEVRAHKPLVIEIPGAANSTAARMSPTTIFILANGERLEARRFVLTASNLSVSIDRQQRTLPVDMLDINATISANHERGIDLRIPADRSEISLSF